MYLDKNSLIVNNINLGEYVTEVEYNYPKLWGEDSGRNLLGEQSGTFLGVYPKLRVTFRALTQNELETIAPILDSPRQNLTYYDPVKGLITIETYTGDYAIINKNIFTNVNDANEPFQISFIDVRRRP